MSCRLIETTITLLIPVKNEHKGLEYIKPYISVADEIIFVDGNSTDGTQNYIQTNFPTAKLILQGNLKGKGSAIALGLKEVTTDYVMQVDADFPISPEEIRNIKKIMEKDPNLYLIKPSRHLTGGGSEDLTTVRRLGAKALALVARKLHRINWTEVCYAMWTIRREAIPLLNLDEKILNRTNQWEWWLPYGHGFEFDQYVFFTLLKKNVKIIEIPTFELQRKTGGSSLFAPRDGLRTLWIIVRELLR